MRKHILIFVLVFGISLNLSATCYLTVGDEHLPTHTAVVQIALIEISQYIEPVSEVPPSGISSKDCHYVLTLTDLNPGLVVVIKGPKLTSYGESNLEGIQAFKQALFKAIIKKDESKKRVLCKQHAKLLTQECLELTKNFEPLADKETVFDPLTELTWQRNEAGKMNWETAREYCQNLELAGSSDWRLPNRTEVASSHAIQKFFPDRGDYYWSSTPQPEDKYYAWGYSVSEGELFSDWIKNRYQVRCARGQELTAVRPAMEETDEIEVFEEPQEEDSSDDPSRLNWVVALTYASGFNQIVDIYNHNIEEQGHSLEDSSYGLPIAAAFSPYYQFDSGLRVGGRIGPLMYYLGPIDDDEYSFTAFPIEVDIGYTIPMGSKKSKAVYFKGGVSKVNAGGEFVESEALGLAAAGGLEIMRDRKVAIGFEAGIDIASVKLRKYDCSNSSTPNNLDTCDYDSKTVWPIGLTAGFLVIF